MDREKLYRLLRLGIEKDTESIARILAEADDKIFDEFNELDLAFELPSEGRFRVNNSRNM
jgi:Tfp pilus assembly pilus retraction ATPase PilT